MLLENDKSADDSLYGKIQYSKWVKYYSYLTGRKNRKYLELKYNDDCHYYMYTLPPIKGRYVVIDTETTGFEPKLDQILEIGACEVVDGELTKNKFSAYIKPRQKITNTFIHGISDNTYKNLPEKVLDDIKNLNEFKKFVGNSLIFAHNATFDMEFINHELQFRNLETINPLKFRCTMRIYASRFSDESGQINLDACCNRFGIKCFNRHSAIGDAISAAKLLIEMLNLSKGVKIKRNNIVSIDNDKFGHIRRLRKKFVRKHHCDEKLEEIKRKKI